MRALVMTGLILTLTQTPGLAQTIVAHRGASHDAPENTLAAFKLAWEQDADAIEGDFHLTADGQLVCIHDKTTQRTTGVELKVVDSTLEQLQQLDAGAWKDARFAGERIPTLDEVLDTVPDDKAIFIEIKCGPEALPALEAALARRGLPAAQTCVISFQEAVIEQLKRRLPYVPAYWLSGYKQSKTTGAWSPTPDRVLATLRRIGADGFGTQGRREVVDAAFVGRLRDARLRLNVWTLDEPADLLWARDLGFDAITTNRPAFARQVLHPSADAVVAPRP